ncbi:MAG: GntR family transcriptional regulator [Kiritimatiellae bacterium]|nr:GntR family transcriptional regulator [Kiritimatiellia bacterium]
MKSTTRTEHAARVLQRAILNGELKPGQRLPEDSAICRTLGVSRSALSNAWNLLAAEGLVQRKQKVGTYVSETIGQRTVAVLGTVNSLSSSLGYYFRELVEQCHKQIGGAGYRVTLSIGHGDTAETFADSLHLFDDANDHHRLMGVVSTLYMGSLSAKLEKRGTPYVSIVSRMVSHGQCVVLDYRSLCHKGVALLHGLKRRRYVVFSADGSSLTASDRAIGDRVASELCAWLREADPRFEETRFVRVPFDYQCRHAYDAFLGAMETHHPDGVFFLDDGLFDVASRAMVEHGIRVPHDLTVVTHANRGRHFQFPGPVLRVEFDPAEAVKMAWELLDSQIHDKHLDSPVVFLAPHVRKTEAADRRRAGPAIAAGSV